MNETTGPAGRKPRGWNDVRSLARGLAVLRGIAEHGACSLAELTRATKLPKSTTRRLLATLEGLGFVRQGVADGLYRVNPLLGPGASDGRAALALAAAPVLRDMAAVAPWPSDVLIRDGIMMETVENNRRFSPLALHHSMIGERVTIAQTAVGRAYLAWCPEEERQEVMEALARSAAAFDARALLAELEATRRRGYGVRHARFVGGTERNPMAFDHLDAIAVPIRHGEGVIGCINMMWPRRMRLDPGFLERNRKYLEASAERIARRWAGEGA